MLTIASTNYVRYNFKDFIYTDVIGPLRETYKDGIMYQKIQSCSRNVEALSSNFSFVFFNLVLRFFRMLR